MDRTEPHKARQAVAAATARAPETDEEKALYERYRQTRQREERGLTMTAAHCKIVDSVEDLDSPYRWMLAHYIVQYSRSRIASVLPDRLQAMD